MRTIQAAVHQRLQCRFDAELRMQPVAACQQLLQQAAQGAQLDTHQGVCAGCVLRVKQRGRAKVAQQDLALAVVQQVVGVQVAMQDATLV